MSFIRLEDAEFRALFSLIPSRVCFVYYISRVSTILNNNNITIYYIFLYYNSCDLLCAGDLMILLSPIVLFIFPQLLWHWCFYSVLNSSEPAFLKTRF